MGKNSVSFRHEALALERAHNHVDLRDDALDALVRLHRVQSQLQNQAVNLVDHQAQLHLQAAARSLLPAQHRMCVQ